MLKYLNDMLGLNATISEWNESKLLPLYLRSGREYFVLSVGDNLSLVIRCEVGTFNMSGFQKQSGKLREYWSGSIVLWFESLSSRQRKALIEQHIQFVVPGSQLYMPELGMILRERVNYQTESVSNLSTKSQLLFLCLLYQEKAEKLSKSELAERLNVSAMSITRAAQELVSLGLASIEHFGRKDFVVFVDTKEQIMELAKPYLISPVQAKMYVRRSQVFEGLPLAGESALAESTMLNPSDVEWRAIGAAEYKKIGADSVERIDPSWYDSKDYIGLEIWKYDPIIFAKNQCVDPVSLLASFIDNKDERIEEVIEEMLEALSW